MRIDLDTKQRDLLIEVVGHHLEELRTELRRTDSHEFRERLKARQEELTALQEALEAAHVAAETP